MTSRINRREFLAGVGMAAAAARSVVGQGRRTRLVLLGTGGGPRPRTANSASAFNAQLEWLFVFPASRICTDARRGPPSRSDLHESAVQRAVAQAARQAGIRKRVRPHTFRHSSAMDLLEDAYDIRTVQELLGHGEVNTTMVYTHVLNRGPLAVRSPVDRHCGDFEAMDRHSIVLGFLSSADLGIVQD